MTFSGSQRCFMCLCRDLIPALINVRESSPLVIKRNISGRQIYQVLTRFAMFACSIHSTIHPNPNSVTILLSCLLERTGFVCATARGHLSGKCTHRPSLKSVLTGYSELLYMKEENTNFHSPMSSLQIISDKS